MDTEAPAITEYIVAAWKILQGKNTLAYFTARSVTKIDTWGLYFKTFYGGKTAISTLV
jgi:hypothetical protein